MSKDTMMEAGAAALPVACVVYHGGCVDGLFGLAVVRRALEGKGYEVRAIAGAYNKPLLSMEGAALVVCVDFCPTAEQLQDLRAAHDNVTIIDHHDTARPLLERVFSVMRVVFDLDESGATLAWRHYFPDEHMPTLLAYVRDRDLWRWELPGSKAINYMLQKLKRTEGALPSFELWDDVDYIAALAKQGMVEMRVRDEAVLSAVARCHWRQVGIHRVPCTMMQLWESELGHELLNAHPEALMSANISVQPDGSVRFSVRSCDRVHVGQLMSNMFGGGGHPNAAGAEFADVAELERCCPTIKHGGQL